MSLLLLTRDTTGIDQHMKTILIVDDDWVSRREISEFLRHRGYQVYEARDADFAIDLMMRRYFDVAISALRLAGTLQSRHFGGKYVGWASARPTRR
jgi:CheY-like chemotaxis protein